MRSHHYRYSCDFTECPNLIHQIDTTGPSSAGKTTVLKQMKLHNGIKMSQREENLSRAQILLCGMDAICSDSLYAINRLSQFKDFIDNTIHVRHVFQIMMPSYMTFAFPGDPRVRCRVLGWIQTRAHKTTQANWKTRKCSLWDTTRTDQVPVSPVACFLTETTQGTSDIICHATVSKWFSIHRFPKQVRRACHGDVRVWHASF